MGTPPPHIHTLNCHIRRLVPNRGIHSIHCLVVTVGRPSTLRPGLLYPAQAISLLQPLHITVCRATQMVTTPHCPLQTAVPTHPRDPKRRLSTCILVRISLERPHRSLRLRSQLLLNLVHSPNGAPQLIYLQNRHLWLWCRHLFPTTSILYQPIFMPHSISSHK